MKKIIFMLAMLLCCFFSSHAQNFYYASEGKTHLNVSIQKALIQFHEGTNFETQQQILSNYKQILPLTPDMLLPAPKVTVIELEGIESEEAVYELLQELQTFPQVKYANHFLTHKDGTLHGVMDRVLVRLKTLDQFATFDKAMRNHPNVESLSVNQFEPLLMEVIVKGEINALELANSLHESNRFAYAEPDFLRIMSRFNTNDPDLDDQWSLDNDGVNTSPWGGIAGSDMDVFDAWGTTTGDASIKVAILDEGVDLDHPDLEDNMLTGFDATGLGSGGDPSGNDAHGTACAGIVAAVGNNNLGGAGVAYGSKIVPVRIAYSNAAGSWITSNLWIGNAINWSWDEGEADVLSNSWGGGGSSFTINSAIDNAVEDGRDGLGSPVLFAAGNNNGANSYPATYAPTISVIAMSMCDQRKSPTSCDGEFFWGSNFGAGADVAAPGVKIFTTDIANGAGYSGGDYTSTFNGTSSATPNAAGVMALILSANDSLTETDARFALESTTSKVGGYTYNSNVANQPNGTWSTDLGYGRVNAEAAVLSVASATENDAGITAVNAPTGNICSTTATPELTLRNYGSNTLTSVTINYSLDGGINNTFSWTGSLEEGATTTVTLPAITFSNGSHTLLASTENPNGQTDENTANDEATTLFAAGTNDVTLTITFDQYPEETTWQIVNASNEVVASGLNYANQADNSTIIEDFCLADGCFDFIINDTYGDGICCGFGNGSYSLTDDAGNVLASGGQFSSSETTNFCVSAGTPLAISVSAVDAICFGGNEGSATVTASGGSGNYSYSWSNGETTPSITNLTAGTYTVTVTDGTDSETETVTIEDGTPNTYFADTDGDGFGDVDNTTLGGCDVPNGYVTNNIDCDDTNPVIYPNAPEICDGFDNDCNGQTDENGSTTYYADMDEDGFGDAANSIQACSPPIGYVTDNTDCDDINPVIYPNAPEICDGFDNDCNGQTDENGSTTYYADMDGDGFGDVANSIQACSPPIGYVTDNTDCDDTNPVIYPNAPEICDGFDNDCNGQTDENGSTTYYADMDGDGFGDTANSIQACSPPIGYVTDNTDCDDTDANNYIGVTCDDNDPTTTGDVIDTNCNCVGTPTGGGCTDNEVTLTLNLDLYPEETTWELTNSAGDVLYSGGAYDGQDEETITETFCLPEDCYEFTIYDLYNDGICCAYGNGSYSLTNAGGNILASGGNFGSQETNTFCFGELQYCGSEGNNQNYEYIEAIEIGSINHTSGNNGGYADFTNLSANANLGETVTVNLTPGFPINPFTENWRIWIDYNQDGDFDDANENVLTTSSNSVVSDSFTIPSNAATGATRMRVSMKWSSFSTPCESFTYGEVEDYTMVIGGNTTQSGKRRATPRFVRHKVGTVGTPLTFTQDYRAESTLQLFPNPVQDFITIQAEFAADKVVEMSITDMSGRVVFEQSGIETFGNRMQERVNVQEFPIGMYLVRIVGGKEVLTERFSKQN